VLISKMRTLCSVGYILSLGEFKDISKKDDITQNGPFQSAVKQYL
jgi:hypothetical protein